MTIDVSVVVVTYNSKQFLPACFEALTSHTKGVTYELIVVDNASGDGTADVVAREYPSATLVRRPTNAGFAHGINDGVAASSGRFVMALNPDTRIDGDVLTALAAYLDAHADAGIVAPKLLNDDGTLQMSCRAFPGYSTALFNRYSLLTKLFPSNRFSRGYLMHDFDHTTTRDVDWVSGAALMFPREVFDRVGGWDPLFFMFSEDVDFCLRVHEAGLRVVYHPEARIYHRIGVSKNAPARLIVARHRSMWRYYRKHLHGGALRDAVTAAGITARCGWVLLGQAVGHARARLRG